MYHCLQLSPFHLGFLGVLYLREDTEGRSALCSSHAVCLLTGHIAALCPGMGCAQDPWLSTSLLFSPAYSSFSHCSHRARLLEGCLQGSKTHRAAEALVPSLILSWLHLGDKFHVKILRFRSFVEVRRV